MRPRPVALTAAFTLALVALNGCHSAFIQATVVNHSGGVVHLFEVDYPSASFGGDELANGGVFHYRFKVLGTGHAKAIWTDAGQHDHTAQGPELQEGEQGSLRLTLTSKDASWETDLHGR